MRVLITGGQGQLGRELQAALSDHQVFAPGHRDLDVTDFAAVQRGIDQFQPDVVIHAAAWLDTVGAEAEPERAMRVNGEGTRHVAEACRDVGIAMLHVSTNEVFDGEKGEPYLEEDPPNPINSHGRSKLAAERHVQRLVDRFYIVRTEWLYAAGGNNFPAKVLRAAQQQPVLRMVTDEIASPTWARDLAAAIVKLIQQPVYGIYHLTNEGYCSRLQWAAAILSLAGKEAVPMEAITQAEFGAPYRKPVFSALANRRGAALGIRLRPWEEALAEYFATTPVEALA